MDKPLFKDSVFFILGLMGAAIIVIGLATPVARTYYVLGSFLLLLTAIHYQLIFFAALELIMFSGHGAVLLNISPALQIVLPILLSAQLLMYYILSEQLNDIFLVIGILGIATLSTGFAFEQEWLTFLGSLSIGIYALHLSLKGQKVVYVWTFLNFFLAIISLKRILY